MAHNIGIWIDHREAVIVSIDGQEQRVETYASGVEKPPHQGGGAPSKSPWGAQDIISDPGRHRRFHHQLDHYYQDVIGKLTGADAILIFGPGAAKMELKKHLDDTHNLRDRIVAMETADKMTKPQIAAKVREFYTGRK